MDNHPGQAGAFEVGWPQFLPGGRRFLYVIFSSTEEQNGVWMADADGSHGAARGRRSVAGGVRPPRLAAVRARVDPGRATVRPGAGALSGEPVPVADGLGVSAIGLAAFSVSRDGVLAFRASGAGLDQLTFFDRKGTRESTPVETGKVNQPDLLAGRSLARLRPRGRRQRRHLAARPAARRHLALHFLEEPRSGAPSSRRTGSVSTSRAKKARVAGRSSRARSAADRRSSSTPGTRSRARWRRPPTAAGC